MTLYVNAVGPANAPTIVFLHGGGVSSAMWHPQIEALQNDYRCVVVDMPEQGKSIDEKPFTMQDTAARIAGLIRMQVNGAKAHVVGLSLGSQVIVQLLSMAPDVVDHAVISGTNVHPIPGAWMLNAVAAMYMPFRNIPSLVRANLKQLDLPDWYYEQFAANTRLLTAQSFAHVMSENMRFKLPPGLDQVMARVLILVGQKELRTMFQSASDLKQAIPNSEVRVAPNVGHNWSLQNSELFTRVVRAWIEDQPLPAEMLPLPSSQ